MQRDTDVGVREDGVPLVVGDPSIQQEDRRTQEAEQARPLADLRERRKAGDRWVSVRRGRDDEARPGVAGSDESEGLKRGVGVEPCPWSAPPENKWIGRADSEPRTERSGSWLRWERAWNPEGHDAKSWSPLAAECPCRSREMFALPFRGTEHDISVLELERGGRQDSGALPLGGASRDVLQLDVCAVIEIGDREPSRLARPCQEVRRNPCRDYGVVRSEGMEELATALRNSICGGWLLELCGKRDAVSIRLQDGRKLECADSRPAHAVPDDVVDEPENSHSAGERSAAGAPLIGRCLPSRWIRAMEIIRILRTLQQRRIWVAVGLVVALVAAVLPTYNVSVFPPSLAKKRTIEYGAATTQILIDSSASSLPNLDRSFDPLQARAGVYAHLVTSPAVLKFIARETGIPVGQIYAEGPVNTQASRETRAPTAEVRSGEILGEGSGYRLQFQSEGGLPVITVYASAPTPAGAIGLANGAARGLRAYIDELQQGQRRLYSGARVAISQLGAARGGMVNPGAARQVNVLVGVGVFVGWLLIVVFVSNIVTDYRRTRELEKAEFPPTGSAERNGDDGLALEREAAELAASRRG